MAQVVSLLASLASTVLFCKPSHHSFQITAQVPLLQAQSPQLSNHSTSAPEAATIDVSGSTLAFGAELGCPPFFVTHLAEKSFSGGVLGNLQGAFARIGGWQLQLHLAGGPWKTPFSTTGFEQVASNIVTNDATNGSWAVLQTKLIEAPTFHCTSRTLSPQWPTMEECDIDNPQILAFFIPGPASVLGTSMINVNQNVMQSHVVFPHQKQLSPKQMVLQSHQGTLSLHHHVL